MGQGQGWGWGVESYLLQQEDLPIGTFQLPPLAGKVGAWQRLLAL